MPKGDGGRWWGVYVEERQEGKRGDKEKKVVFYFFRILLKTILLIPYGLDI